MIERENSQRTLPPATAHTYPAADAYTAVVTAANSVSAITATTVVTTFPQVISYEYDPLGRLTSADYASGEQFAYLSWPKIPSASQRVIRSTRASMMGRSW